MKFDDEKDAIDKLTDSEKNHWLSDISEYEYEVLSALAVRAEIFDDKLLREIVKIRLEMAPSRQGRRVENIIEFGKAIQAEGLPPGADVDSFEDAGNILAQAESNVEKA